MIPYNHPFICHLFSSPQREALHNGLITEATESWSWSPHLVSLYSPDLRFDVALYKFSSCLKWCLRVAWSYKERHWFFALSINVFRLTTFPLPEFIIKKHNVSYNLRLTIISFLCSMIISYVTHQINVCTFLH